MEYFTFGMKTLRVTQSYDGSVSHKPHWYKSTNYCDYPVDVAGADSGTDIFYAPVDMKVVAIRGINNLMTNTIWLVSIDDCKTPSGTFKPFLMLTHWNDNDPYISKLKANTIVKKGQPICFEGRDGASANHLHVVVGNSDKGIGNNIILNSNNKWVSNGFCMKPEEVMYIDSKFTKIITSGGIKFKSISEFEDNSFFGTKGYFSLGNFNVNIGKICYFFAEYFYGYFYTGYDAKSKAHKVLDGNYFGPYLKKWTIEFQKRAKQDGVYDDEIDGCIGPKTLSALIHYGFKY